MGCCEVVSSVNVEKNTTDTPQELVVTGMGLDKHDKLERKINEETDLKPTNHVSSPSCLADKLTLPTLSSRTQMPGASSE